MRNVMKFHAIAALTLLLTCLTAYGQDKAETFNVTGTMTSGHSTNENAPNIEAVEEEIQIMAKVLEESINNAGIEDWKAGRGLYSAFDPSIGGHIQGRYVPSVGALFVVPVAFPLRADGSHSEGDHDSEPVEPDLWEKNQRSSATYRIRKRMPVVVADENVRVKIVSPGSVVIDEDIIVDTTTNPQTKTIVRRGSGGGRVGGGGLGGGGGGGRSGGGGFGGGGGGGRVGGGGGAISWALGNPDGVAAGKYNIVLSGQEYDEEKVAKLRATLIDTVAEYGHRMDQLQPDERIFVIVESDTHEPRNLDVLFGSDFAPLFQQTLVSPFGRSTAKYQIVVRKRDLTEKTTAKALEGKIEETEY